MSLLADWIFRRPSLDDLAKEAERAIADGSIRRYTWARDEARRELLRVLRLPHVPTPLAIVADEDTPDDNSSLEPHWEAEHGPDTASSPYRSPAPMPPKQEKPMGLAPSRMRHVARVVMTHAVSIVLGVIVAQLFVWCVGR